ncbi:MAG: hypothetical protein M1113_01430 [Candidatus Thermoplasmatota archaeon]|nr:hypothetical protein [Candidatus Thermoplasmatota archaeon]
MAARIENIKEYVEVGSHASDGACYSAAQFIIGNALLNCYFEDNLGRVHSNLSFVWASPSSTFKTPLLRIHYELYCRELKDQRVHFKSKFTTEGLMESLHQYRKKYEEKGEVSPVYRCIVLRDEASNLAKESKSGRSSNIWEFLSETFDGSIYPYDTVRGKSQEYPRVWFSFWFSSTLSLYQNLSDDFWEQGFAFRCLFVKPEKKEYEPMGGDIERETAIEGIISQIKPLYQIERAVVSQEWWDRYNDYVKQIVERGNNEVDKLLSAENVDIEEKAEKKYPEMVIKLSMIHCASRDGWKEENGIKKLFMEKEDIENAISDLRIYKDNFIQAYNSYEFKKREKARIEKISDEERKKVMTMIEEAPLEERFEYREEVDPPTRYRGEDEENTRLIAYRTSKGRYISKSYIYKKTRWNKKTVDDVLTAMENAEEIEEIEAEREGSKRGITLIRSCKIR